MNASPCNYYIRITRCGLDPTVEPRCNGDCSCCTIKALPDALADGESYPTVNQVWQVYCSLNPKRVTRDAVGRGIAIVMRLLGLTMESEMRALANAKAIEKFYSDAVSVMSQATAVMRVNAVRSLCSKAVRAACKELKLRVEPMPTVSVPSKIRGGKYEKLSPEVRVQLVSLYDDLLANDPALWLVMEGCWNEGKRMTDVMHTRWGDYIVDGPRVTDVYTPHKTKDSSRETVRFPIDPITWMRMSKIQAAINGYEGGFMFKGHNAETASDWPLGQRFNKLLRERVPYFRNTTKAAHELRKDRSQSLIDQYGIEETAKLLGDNPQTLRKYYYDRHHVSFVPQGVGL